MNYATEIYCSTCFALPGELCRTKFLVHGRDEVTPVICPTHETRVADSEREAMRHSLAQLLCSVTLKSLESSESSNQRQRSAALSGGRFLRRAR